MKGVSEGRGVGVQSVGMKQTNHKKNKAPEKKNREFGIFPGVFDVSADVTCMFLNADCRASGRKRQHAFRARPTSWPHWQQTP